MGHPPIIVAIDQKGVPVAPFIISETYTVEENTAALAEVSIDSYAWYDGAELAQLDPINFAGFEEYAVLLLKYPTTTRQLIGGQDVSWAI